MKNFVEDRLLDYLDDSLSETEKQQFLDHLASDEELRLLVEDWQQVLKLVRNNLDVYEPSPATDKAILQLAEKALLERKRRSFLGFPLDWFDRFLQVPYLKPITLFALLVLVVGLISLITLKNIRQTSQAPAFQRMPLEEPQPFRIEEKKRKKHSSQTQRKSSLNDLITSSIPSHQRQKKELHEAKRPRPAPVKKQRAPLVLKKSHPKRTLHKRRRALVDDKYRKRRSRRYYKSKRRRFAPKKYRKHRSRRLTGTKKVRLRIAPTLLKPSNQTGNFGGLGGFRGGKRKSKKKSNVPLRRVLPPKKSVPSQQPAPSQVGWPESTPPPKKERRSPKRRRGVGAIPPFEPPPRRDGIGGARPPEPETSPPPPPSVSAKKKMTRSARLSGSRRKRAAHPAPKVKKRRFTKKRPLTKEENERRAYLIALKNDLLSSRERARISYQLARIELKRRHLKKARHFFETAVRLCPNRRKNKLYWDIYRAYRLSGYRREAKRILRLLIKRDPRSARRYRAELKKF